jgi:hypothetical protein
MFKMQDLNLSAHRIDEPRAIQKRSPLEVIDHPCIIVARHDRSQNPVMTIGSLSLTGTLGAGLALVSTSADAIGEWNEEGCGRVSTGAMKRYPRVGTVSMILESRLESPNSRRRMPMVRVSVFSST